VIIMVKKTKKAYKCPHCKKKIYVEDLELIEDTRGAGAMPANSPGKLM
jgi:hypothetical protein